MLAPVWTPSCQLTGKLLDLSQVPAKPEGVGRARAVKRGLARARPAHARPARPVSAAGTYEAVEEDFVRKSAAPDAIVFPWKEESGPASPESSSSAESAAAARESAVRRLSTAAYVPIWRACRRESAAKPLQRGCRLTRRTRQRVRSAPALSRVRRGAPGDAQVPQSVRARGPGAWQPLLAAWHR